jgi:hypothetical protein
LGVTEVAQNSFLFFFSPDVLQTWVVASVDPEKCPGCKFRQADLDHKSSADEIFSDFVQPILTKCPLPLVRAKWPPPCYRTKGPIYLGQKAVSRGKGT